MKQEEILFDADFDVNGYEFGIVENHRNEDKTQIKVYIVKDNHKSLVVTGTSSENKINMKHDFGYDKTFINDELDEIDGVSEASYLAVLDLIENHSDKI